MNFGAFDINLLRVLDALMRERSVTKAGESALGELQKMTDQRVDAALERLGIGRADEVAALTRRIELLEKHVAPK